MLYSGDSKELKNKNKGIEVEREEEEEEEEEEDSSSADLNVLDKIDDDFELGGMRERRLEELRSEIIKNQRMKENDHGRYSEIKDEKELIKITANSKMSIVHFFHNDFKKCKMMDKSLEELSTKHFSTRFLRVEVANVPWLVKKLEIKILPCLISFVDGISKDRILGFEGVSDESGSQIDLNSLELRLIQSGSIKLEDQKFGINLNSSNKRTSNHSIKNRFKLDNNNNDDDDDWD